MPFTEPMPQPPPPDVPQVDSSGRPTQAWVEYQVKMKAWLKKLAAAIP